MFFKLFRHSYRSQLAIYSVAFIAVTLTLTMIKYPKETFDAAILGVNLWWTIVFPSLLPFFIFSELLMGLGVVHFIGVLLEPLMRPLFNVPGVGSFALSMGLASGYPMDAVITCKFRKNRLCSAVEAERLLSFTNTADPLFMFGAVAVGMFGMPELGAVLAAAHYLASFLVGIVFRWHGANDKDKAAPPSLSPLALCKQAFQALYQARREDQRPLGQLMGDAVKTSMQTALLIGGFIILFSVLLKILTLLGTVQLLTQLFATLLAGCGWSPQLAPALVSGLFEIDLGTLAASQAAAPLDERLAAAGAIIAWSGLSVHGQVASIVIESGIRMAPYMFARLLHALLAAALTWVLLTMPVFSVPTVATALWLPLANASRFDHAVMYWLYTLLIMLTLSLSLQLIKITIKKK